MLEMRQTSLVLHFMECRQKKGEKFLTLNLCRYSINDGAWFELI